MERARFCLIAYGEGVDLFVCLWRGRGSISFPMEKRGSVSLPMERTWIFLIAYGEGVDVFDCLWKRRESL